MHDTDTDPRQSRHSAADEPTGTPRTGRYLVDEDESLDVAITYAIAAVEGIDPQDVHPPLHDVVDPEALERLFDSATGEARARFSLGPYVVAVEDGGRAVVVDHG